MKIGRIICILMVLFSVSFLNAQRSITGHIVDRSGEPIIGANVIVSGTSMGTLTDIDGAFSIGIPGEIKTIQISYSGYNTLKVNIEGQNTFIINLDTGEVNQNAWNQAKVKSVTREAIVTAKSASVNQSIRYLDGQLRSVSQSEEHVSYHAYLLFAKGYIYHQYGEGARNDNLQAAKLNYQRSLRLNSTDINVINNLIIVSRSLEDWSGARRYVQMALEQDAQNATKWKTLLADISKQEGNYENAWSDYVDILNSDFENRDVAQKLIELYPNMKTMSPGALIRKCLELDDAGLSAPALEGMDQVIQIQCIPGQVVSEESVLAWAKILVKNDWVKSRLKKQIKRINCDAAPFDRLSLFMENGWIADLDAGDWWRRNDKRTYYFLALQKGWADYLSSDGKADQAKDLYLNCYHRLKEIQDYSPELFGTEGALEMDVLIRLAHLYGKSERFGDLEDQLFNDKGDAYRSNDLKRILKYHTILGMIYVNREQWSGSFAKNAQFQLSRAVKTANQITKEDPTQYAPIPHLYKLLGEVHLKNNNSKEAARAFQDASIGYLESDHIQLSDQMLKKAQPLVRSAYDKKLDTKQKEVSMILNARKSTKELTKASFDQNSSTYFRKEKDFEWLDQSMTIETIDQSIVERQKFKILADLGSQARSAGATDKVETLEEEAKSAGEKVHVLSSYQDLVRFNKVDKTKYNAGSKSIDSKSRYTEEELKSQNEKVLPNRSSQKSRITKSNSGNLRSN